MSATSEHSSAGTIVRAYAERLYLLALVMWAGALWTIGFVVAPTLFQVIEERALAGNVAASLFHSLNWIGIVAGAYLLLHCVMIRGTRALHSLATWLVLVMWLIALTMQFGIQPMMAEMRTAASFASEVAMRERFALWHGVSSVLYVIQSVLAVVLVVRIRRELS